MVTKSMQEVRGQGQHKQENWKTWQRYRCVCGNKYNNKSVNESEKNSMKWLHMVKAPLKRTKTAK